MPYPDALCCLADVLGSAVGWAAGIRGSPLLTETLQAWKARPDTFSLGVCNGCQLMALMGWMDQQQVNSFILLIGID